MVVRQVRRASDRSRTAALPGSGRPGVGRKPEARPRRGCPAGRRVCGNRRKATHEAAPLLIDPRARRQRVRCRARRGAGRMRRQPRRPRLRPERANAVVALGNGRSRRADARRDGLGTETQTASSSARRSHPTAATAACRWRVWRRRSACRHAAGSKADTNATTASSAPTAPATSGRSRAEANASAPMPAPGPSRAPPGRR